MADRCGHWPSQGDGVSVDVLMAEAVAALNAAPSDDQYMISPMQLAFARSPHVPLALLVKSPFGNVRDTSVLKPLAQQFNELSSAFAAQAIVRNEQRVKERQQHERAFAAHRGPEIEPQPGDWLWARFPRSDVGTKSEARLAWSGPWQVVNFDDAHQRVDVQFVGVALGPHTEYARASVHVRNVRPYVSPRPLDDLTKVDGSVMPLDWESKAAPLGGLSQQPPSVQKLLLKATEEAERQAKATAAELERAEQREREAAAQRAEAEQQQQLEAQQQQERERLERERRAAEERALAERAARASLITRVMGIRQHADGYKLVLVLRNDGLRTEIRRDNAIFQNGYAMQMVRDYEAAERANRGGQRMKAATARAQAQRAARQAELDAQEAAFGATG